MTSPIDSGDPLAAIAAQQAALAAAVWKPIAVAGVETAPVQGLVAARRIGTTGPVLWLDTDDWAAYQDGDPDIRLTLEALAG